jgi:hypothetical protein
LSVLTGTITVSNNMPSLDEEMTAVVTLKTLKRQ